MSFLQALLPHPTEHQVDGLPLESGYEEDLLALKEGDEGGVVALEAAVGLSDVELVLFDDLYEVLLQLVPEHLPEGRHLCVLLTVLLDAVDDAHGPLHRHRLQAVLLVEKSVHVRLQSLHRDA